MKYARYGLTGIVAFVALSMVNINAKALGKFTIETNSVWKSDLSSTASVEVKSGANKYSGVNWTYSNKSSHKMIFRICNSSNGKSFGSGTLKYKSQDTFKTSIPEGTKTYIQARRENIIDPVTTVKGTWLP